MEDRSSYEELLARVERVTGLEGRPAQAVTMMLLDGGDGDAITAVDIVRMARELHYQVEEQPERVRGDAMSEGLRSLQLEPDAAEVLKHVYRTTPRVLNANIPVIGRAPKESVFYSEDLREQIDALPEDVRVLIGGVDVIDGSVTFRLYDEANDLDREIGPIDLTRYADGEQIRGAIEVLISRLPRVLSSDFN